MKPVFLIGNDSCNSDSMLENMAKNALANISIPYNAASKISDRFKDKYNIKCEVDLILSEIEQSDFIVMLLAPGSNDRVMFHLGYLYRAKALGKKIAIVTSYQTDFLDKEFYESFSDFVCSIDNFQSFVIDSWFPHCKNVG